MILGAGWAFLGLIAVGIAAVVLTPSIGLLVVATPDGSDVRLDAPALVEADPAVKARGGTVAAVSLARARREVRARMLRIRNAGCDGVRSGSGFALDSRLLVADREVVPGATALRVAARKAHARPVDAKRVFGLGELVVAHVGRRLQRVLPPAPKTGSGASVAIVGYPLSAKPRLVPGVVVDSVAGAPFGVRGRVMRVASALRRDEPGGPVIDAKGRLVAVAFTHDPGTGLAVAVPIGTLRALVAKRALDALAPCNRA